MIKKLLIHIELDEIKSIKKLNENHFGFHENFRV